jgi:hypothetical protein
VVFWQSAEKSGKAGDYEAYLSAFPNGVFKPLARTRLAALTPASAPPPPIEIEEVDATYLALKTVNLRSGPGTSFDKVGRDSKEKPLNMTGRVTGKKWLRIAHAGGSAFVFAPLVSEIDPLELAAWQNLASNPAREELQTFIKRFNAGHYAQKAQAMLAALPPPKPVYKVMALSKTMQIADSKTWAYGESRPIRHWSMRSGARGYCSLDRAPGGA